MERKFGDLKNGCLGIAKCQYSLHFFSCFFSLIGKER